MFSGKSEELIRRIKRYRIALEDVLIIKPAIDTRQPTLHSRASKLIDNLPGNQWIYNVPDSSHIMDLFNLHWPNVVAIDEAQFFDTNITTVLQELLHRSPTLRVIVAGLDMDAWGKPFGPVPNLMALADDVVKLTAICFNCCSDEAIYTFKKSAGQGQVEVGDADLYEARCRQCWHTPQV